MARDEAVRMGWVIDQGRTLDIPSLRYSISTTATLSECPVSKWKHKRYRFAITINSFGERLSDFEVAHRKEKADADGESVTERKRSCGTSVAL